MPHHEHRIISGTVTHVFGHRFVVRTGEGDVLADLTPRGQAQVALRPDDEVICEGEMKPSELKVSRLTKDSQTFNVEHKKPGEHPHRDANPAIARSAAQAAGYKVISEPRRKHKHFEILAESPDGLFELHIEPDGFIRKAKSASRDDHKWVPAAQG